MLENAVVIPTKVFFKHQMIGFVCVNQLSMQLTLIDFNYNGLICDFDLYIRKFSDRSCMNEKSSPNYSKMDFYSSASIFIHNESRIKIIYRKSYVMRFVFGAHMCEPFIKFSEIKGYIQRCFILCCLPFGR